MLDTPDLLTRQEAAAHLGVSLRTLDYWREQGKLPAGTETRHATNRKSVRFRRAGLDELKDSWITRED
jgi:excisionase family DNA binding protein